MATVKISIIGPGSFVSFSKGGLLIGPGYAEQKIIINNKSNKNPFFLQIQETNIFNLLRLAKRLFVR